MKLNAQPGARQRVPELMSHPRRKLRQHVGALRLADRLTHLPKLGAHPVDRPGQVVDLVAWRLRVQHKLAEVALGDPGHLVLQAVNSPTDAVGDPCGRGRHERQRPCPEYQRDLGRLPPCVAQLNSG